MPAVAISRRLHRLEGCHLLAALYLLSFVLIFLTKPHVCQMGTSVLKQCMVKLSFHHFISRGSAHWRYANSVHSIRQDTNPIFFSDLAVKVMDLEFCIFSFVTLDVLDKVFLTHSYLKTKQPTNLFHTYI